jgi:hypothetical protein
LNEVIVGHAEAVKEMRQPIKYFTILVLDYIVLGIDIRVIPNKNWNLVIGPNSNLNLGQNSCPKSNWDLGCPD